MVAQALEGGADLLSSGLILIGVKMSKRPADKRHPYGYGRELYFWTFVSGLATFGVTATLSFYFGLRRFLSPEPVHHLAAAYAVLLFTVFSNGYAARSAAAGCSGIRSRCSCGAPSSARP